MNEPYIHVKFRPELDNPILVAGLPGLGNVGKIVAHLLIESSRAKLFAELYSPYFPDYIFIDERGICRPSRYEFYASTTSQNLIILTGDMQPSLDDVTAHYEVCGRVLDFIGDYGSKFVITVCGVPSSSPSKEIYVAATSRMLAAECMEKGSVIYGRNRIMDDSGLLLGLAKKRGLKGICLMSLTSGLTVDEEAAFRVFKFLTRILEFVRAHDFC